MSQRFYPLTRNADRRANIRDLVEQGRRLVHSGHYAALTFHVWDREEADYLDQCMDACPNIPYAKDWIVL